MAGLSFLTPGSEHSPFSLTSFTELVRLSLQHALFLGLGVVFRKHLGTLWGCHYTRQLVWSVAELILIFSLRFSFTRPAPPWTPPPTPIRSCSRGTAQMPLHAHSSIRGIHFSDNSMRGLHNWLDWLRISQTGRWLDYQDWR